MMANTPTNPEHYTLAQLLDDPSFMAWILEPTPQLTAHWQALQHKHTHLPPLIAQARQLLLSLRFEQQALDAQAELELWELIKAQTITKPKRVAIVPMWIKQMAVAMLACICIGSVFYYRNVQKTTITTGYAQTKTFLLPDSSELTLNANSSIQYTNNWDKHKAREVWLKGEAFFKVNHLHRQGKIANKDRFIVHANKVDVEVLGTTFNVKERRGLVNVALISGKLRMGIGRTVANALLMQPGDVLEYQSQSNKIIRKLNQSRSAVAWKNDTMVLEALSAEALFYQLEDIYGYQAVFKNPAIKTKRLSGTFSTTNPDNLLKGIGLALGVSIRKDETQRQLIIQ